MRLSEMRLPCSREMKTCCQKVRDGISVRAVMKTISYRLLGTATTALLAYAYTQDVERAVSIGAFDFAAKILLYYVHERVWECIPAAPSAVSDSSESRNPI